MSTRAKAPAGASTTTMPTNREIRIERAVPHHEERDAMLSSGMEQGLDLSLRDARRPARQPR
jgi:hypothetical protein